VASRHPAGQRKKRGDNTDLISRSCNDPRRARVAEQSSKPAIAFCWRDAVTSLVKRKTCRLPEKPDNRTYLLETRISFRVLDDDRSSRQGDPFIKTSCHLIFDRPVVHRELNLVSSRSDEVNVRISKADLLISDRKIHRASKSEFCAD